MLDPRLVRIGIEVDGAIKYYEDLNIEASGTKYANAIQNECEVKITNLSKQMRDYILSETSPFLKARIEKKASKKANPNSTKQPKSSPSSVHSGKKIIIEAGRASYGYSRVYVGEITAAVPSQPPDITLTIKSATGNASKGDIVVRSAPATAMLSQLSKNVANDLGLQLAFQAKEKHIANYNFTGGNLKQVNKLAELGRVNAYVDDVKLIVKDYNAPLKGNTKVISKDTGMIGIPEITEHGIKVRYLFDNDTVLGGALQIKSSLNPTANGVYTIFKLTFNIANRQDQFHWTAEAKRV